VYASSWLQKPQVPGIFSAINHEDVNGFMTACMDGLRVRANTILHTPGGLGEAAETIVDYLWSKFSFMKQSSNILDVCRNMMRWHRTN